MSTETGGPTTDDASIGAITGGDRDAKDPAEQEALARDLGEQLSDACTRYIRGDLDFADLSFLAFETLQDLHIIASGAYELEYEEDDDPDAGEGEQYDREDATEQQEDLAQEPAGR